MDTLFFVASKLLGAFLKVETWLVVLALVGFWALLVERFRLAKRMAGLLVAAMLVIGVLPLGDLLLRPIEAAYPVVDGLDEIDGIIVLGGGEDPQASAAWGQPQLGGAGDRYMAALALARRHPDARILFAGGSGRLRDAGSAPVSEASIAEAIFAGQGIAPERLLFESRSRNTAENARMSRELADPAPGETWVLVTSALHMRRAMRSFEAAGWADLVAYPVDYRTRAWRDALGWNFGRNLGLVDTVLREWVGTLAYAVTGR